MIEQLHRVKMATEIAKKASLVTAKKAAENLATETILLLDEITQEINKLKADNELLAIELKTAKGEL